MTLRARKDRIAGDDRSIPLPFGDTRVRIPRFPSITFRTGAGTSRSSESSWMTIDARSGMPGEVIEQLTDDCLDAIERGAGRFGHGAERSLIGSVREPITACRALLAAEMVGHRPEIRAGLPGDRPDRRPVVPTSGEQADAGLQEGGLVMGRCLWFHTFV